MMSTRLLDLQRVTRTRCCVDTIDSPDDEPEVAGPTESDTHQMLC
jgi:hypothetical protein